ncbi:MAG: dockerin type I repeat-containing protein [Ruminococcus callidus]
MLYGDVNPDGKVDIVDAVLLNKAAAGVVELNATAKMNADCDADGTMSSNDALALLRFPVHIINSCGKGVIRLFSKTSPFKNFISGGESCLHHFFAGADRIAPLRNLPR